MIPSFRPQYDARCGVLHAAPTIDQKTISVSYLRGDHKALPGPWQIAPVKIIGCSLILVGAGSQR
jgi:hypothetical protein